MKKEEYTTISIPKRAVTVLDELVKTEKGLDSKTRYIMNVVIKQIKVQEDNLKYIQSSKMKKAWDDNEGDAWTKLYLKQVK
jgi:hypothetical protein